MLRINRQTDYAVRVLLALARREEGARLTSTQIRREMIIPEAFLSRIVAQLAQAGLVQTFAGRDGGLQLRRPAEQISLRDVVEIFEGPLMLSECMAGEDNCPFEDNCMVQPRWAGLQAVILKELSKTTFFDLAKEANKQYSTTSAGK